MTILDELIQYSKDCIDGKIISGKKHIWACQRFLSDLEKPASKEFPYEWNEKEAEQIVNWFKLLRHSKGVLAGQPIELADSQKFFLCQIYGWRHVKSGLRRFNKSFLEVARKGAKSQMEAGVALYEISHGATVNGEIYETYCTGTRRDQSKIVFNECKNMLHGSPLNPKFKMTRDAITHIKTGSFLKPLSKEDKKRGDGTSPALLVLDEYHQHDSTEYYDLGLGANSKEPLLMIITTAGMNLNVPCYQQEYKLCSRILNPDIPVQNDRYFVDIFEIDPDDDISDENVWKKANPIRMSYPEGIQKIRDEYKIACDVPEKMIAFRTKCLNQWVQAQDNGYMDMARWNKCLVENSPYDTTGCDVIIGFDMSSKLDLSSVSFIVPMQINGVIKYVLYSHSFIPNKDRLREHITVDHQPYDYWEQAGYITVTDTEVVDQTAVMNYVIEECKKHQWNIECLAFDPNNSTKLMLDLSNEGYEVVEVFQSHKSLNESTNGFREQVYEGNVIAINNPVLNFAMSNAVIRTNQGLIKIDKDATRQRIDPVDATLCAFKLAMYHEFGSTFDTDAWLNESW